ncbi:MAG: hypothetical protein MK033_02370 [Candidatus Caenarcaniphilales bacterium]|nr:hypothetical protein [Candidatus Caenarcaniphilales bacterium]
MAKTRLQKGSLLSNQLELATTRAVKAVMDREDDPDGDEHDLVTLYEKIDRIKQLRDKRSKIEFLRKQ